MNRRQKVILVFLCLIPTTVPDRLPSLNGLKTEQWTRQMSSRTHTTTASPNDNGDTEQTRHRSSRTHTTTASSDDLGSVNIEQTRQKSSSTFSTTPALSDDQNCGDDKQARRVSLSTYKTKPAWSDDLNSGDDEQIRRVSLSTYKTKPAWSDDLNSGDDEQIRRMSSTTHKTTPASSDDLNSGDDEQTRRMSSTTHKTTPASSDDQNNGDVKQARRVASPTPKTTPALSDDQNNGDVKQARRVASTTHKTTPAWSDDLNSGDDEQARRMSSSTHKTTPAWSDDLNSGDDKQARRVSLSTYKTRPAWSDDLNSGDDKQARRVSLSTYKTRPAWSDDLNSGDDKQARRVSLSTYKTKPAWSDNLNSDDVEHARHMLSPTFKTTPASSDDLNSVDVEQTRHLSSQIDRTTHAWSGDLDSSVVESSVNTQIESRPTTTSEFECRDGKTTAEAIKLDLVNNINVKLADLSVNNGSNELHEYFEDLLNASRTLCPYTRFCDQSPLSELINDALVPCCSDCSCDENCGLRADCCFKEMDRYKLKETYKLKCVETKNSFSNLPIGSSSYLMVDKCLIDASNRLVIDESNRLLNDQNTNETKTGLLYPVYSSSTHLIYFNNSTAICNNVLDGVAWQRYFSCPRHRGAFSFSDVISKAILEGICWTDFVPPAIMDIKLFQCNHDVIDSCNTTGDINNISLQTETACKSLQSAYQVQERYQSQNFANVHCLKCNTNKFKSECYRVPARSPFVQFTVLINEKDIHELFETSATAKKKQGTPEESAEECGRDYVRHPFKTECRLLKCAEGRYMGGQECRFISDQWYIWGELFIELFLLPVNSMPIDDLVASEGEEIKDVLKKKGFYWKFLHIYYHQIQTANSTKVQYFVIWLVKEIKNTSFDLSRVIRRLEDAIKNGWNVKIYNQKYKLKVNIGKGYGPLWEISDGVFQSTRRQNGDNDSGILHLLSKREELSSNNLILSPFVLTKLYFCRKVQLENDEYLIDGETLILFPNSTVRKRLYSHEYSLTSISKSPELPEVRNVHVCADDFAPESSVINSHCGSLSNGVSRLLYYLNVFIVIKLSARLF